MNFNDFRQCFDLEYFSWLHTYKENEFHCVRRSGKYRARLWTDLTIEQTNDALNKKSGRVYMRQDVNKTIRK